MGAMATLKIYVRFIAGRVVFREGYVWLIIGSEGPGTPEKVQFVLAQWLTTGSIQEA